MGKITGTFWAGLVLCFLILGFMGQAPLAGKEWPISSGEFDGAKFMQRYGLEPTDFYVVTRGGQTVLVLKDNVTLPDDPPVFEPSDTTNRDRLSVLRARLKSGDLTVSEINEYLRLSAGL